MAKSQLMRKSFVGQLALALCADAKEVWLLLHGNGMHPGFLDPHFPTMFGSDKLEEGKSQRTQTDRLVYTLEFSKVGASGVQSQVVDVASQIQNILKSLEEAIPDQVLRLHFFGYCIGGVLLQLALRELQLNVQGTSSAQPFSKPAFDFRSKHNNNKHFKLESFTAMSSPLTGLKLKKTLLDLSDIAYTKVLYNKFFKTHLRDEHMKTVLELLPAKKRIAFGVIDNHDFVHTLKPGDADATTYDARVTEYIQKSVDGKKSLNDGYMNFKTSTMTEGTWPSDCAFEKFPVPHQPGNHEVFLSKQPCDGVIQDLQWHKGLILAEKQKFETLRQQRWGLHLFGVGKHVTKFVSELVQRQEARDDADIDVNLNHIPLIQTFTTYDRPTTSVQQAAQSKDAVALHIGGEEYQFRWEYFSKRSYPKKLKTYVEKFGHYFGYVGVVSQVLNNCKTKNHKIAALRNWLTTEISVAGLNLYEPLFKILNKYFFEIELKTKNKLS